MPISIRLLLTIALLLALPSQALVNGQAPDEKDTRFDAVAAFSRTNWLIENPEDETTHNWFGNAVLIAPDVVLFAKHLLPGGGQKPIKAERMMVRFRRHVDGSIGSKEKTPDTFHQVTLAKIIPAQGFDLALGVLSEPVKHIKPVAVRFDKEPIEKQACLLAGWGSESNWRGFPQPRNGLRVGDNSVSTNGRSYLIQSYKTERRENKKGKAGSYIIDENAVPNMHDSGGSVFLEDKDGNITLIGIISSYQSGSYLPAAESEAFPLKAATQGAKALTEALDAANTETAN